MKIIELRAENFKRLTAVSITPEGNVIMLTGKNKQGKTTVLDAIWAALDAFGAKKVTSEVVRTGETQASVTLTLGTDGVAEYIVTRRWYTNGKITLTVESPRGAAYGSPQGLLDGLVGKMSMDPMAFIRQQPAQQVTTLVEMLGETLGFDPVALEAKRVTQFEARKVSKRDVKTLEAQIKGMPVPPDGTPESPVAIADLLAELAEITGHNDGVQKLDAEVTSAEEVVELADAAVVRAETVLAIAVRTQGIANEALDALQERFAVTHEKDDTDVKARLASVDEVNQNVRDGAALAEVNMKVVGMTADVAGYDDALDKIAEVRRLGLASANFPLEELSFSDAGVTYNGHPLAQASGAEKRVVGFAVARALEPELRVIRIDEGESLDSEGLAHIAAMADKHDIQVWMTKVTDGDGGGNVIVIEEGAVKE